MAAGLGSAGAELTHHAAQAIGPVAGAKGLTAGGHAEDDDFVGVVAVHKIILGPCGFRLLTMIPPRICTSAPASMAAEPISFDAKECPCLPPTTPLPI